MRPVHSRAPAPAVRRLSRRHLRVQYAVVGDTGPQGVIGEASYATAEALGIRPDPRRGGTDSGVTYIVFEKSRVSPIEDRDATVKQGEALARQLVGGW